MAPSGRSDSRSGGERKRRWVKRQRSVTCTSAQRVGDARVWERVRDARVWTVSHACTCESAQRHKSHKQLVLTVEMIDNKRAGKAAMQRC